MPVPQGGPLACDINDSDLLIGVVSFGYDDNCGEPNSPGIYAKVSIVRDWIEGISGI